MEKTKVRCGDCICFVRDEVKLREGTCHLNPPQIVSVSMKTLQGPALVPGAMFPQIGIDWWCARFAPVGSKQQPEAD